MSSLRRQRARPPEAGPFGRSGHCVAVPFGTDAGQLILGVYAKIENVENLGYGEVSNLVYVKLVLGVYSKLMQPDAPTTDTGLGSTTRSEL